MQSQGVAGRDEVLATREVKRAEHSLMLCVLVVWATCAVAFAGADRQDARLDNLALGVPGSNEVQVVNRRGYALGFSTKHKQPLWVAYCLTATEVTNVVVRRADQFAFDPQIVGGSATLEDYRGSGYDRGHLAPAADMKWDAQAMQESFLLSNISPQVNSFNGGIWKKLEEWCRNLAVRRGSLWIVTGPIFPKDEEYETIGLSRVAVPKYFYKVIYDERVGQMLGFIMPNAPNKNIYKFALPVDEVEEATGLDFFSALPNDVQKELEAECDTRRWNR